MPADVLRSPRHQSHLFLGHHHKRFGERIEERRGILGLLLGEKPGEGLGVHGDALAHPGVGAVGEEPETKVVGRAGRRIVTRRQKSRRKMRFGWPTIAANQS